MAKGIIFTKTQVTAIKNKASLFMFPIDTKLKISEIGLIKDLIQFSPIQKGDKDIFVQEDFRFNEYGDYEYKTGLNTKVTSHLNINQWQPASKMTKEQSRYSFNECIDVRVVRIQEINIKDIPKIQTEMWMFDDWYNQQLKEQNINRTYEDNDYVFLVEFA